jgi:hypothetical protein
MRRERRITMDFKGTVLAFHAISPLSPWERPFIIGAVVYVDGEEVDFFIGKCPILSRKINASMREHYKKTTETINENYPSYAQMLKAFDEFYRKYNKDAIIIIRQIDALGKLRVLLDMHDVDIIHDYEFLPRIYDISSLLSKKDYTCSETKYNAIHNISVSIKKAGEIYNPLYLCKAMGVCYMHLMSNTED